MARRNIRPNRFDERFYEGVNCALAIVAAHDEEVMWREIVAACGGYDKLHAVSKRSDNLDMDGFTQYKRPADPPRAEP